MRLLTNIWGGVVQRSISPLYWPPGNQDDQAARPSHGPDACQHQQSNPHHWFQFTPQQLAAWYNERHTIEELLPQSATGWAWRDGEVSVPPAWATPETGRAG